MTPKKHIRSLAAVGAAFAVAAFAQSQTAENAFLEEDGVIVIEAESMPHDPEFWSLETRIARYSGTGHLVGKQNSLDRGGLGTIRYPIRVQTSGRYQLQWKSAIAEGRSSTDYNDSFARLTNAAGVRLPEVPNNNTREKDPNWYKVFMNRQHRWDYDAKNHDRVDRSLSWQLQAGTLYYLEISIRSKGHAIDRMVLWDHARHNFADKERGTTTREVQLDALTASRRENDPAPAVYDLRPGAVGGFDPVGTNFYLDANVDLAAVTGGAPVLGIDPASTADALDSAAISQTFTGESGRYDILLPTVGENDGRPNFVLKVDGVIVGTYRPPLSVAAFEVGSQYNGRFAGIALENGDTITVEATIATLNGEFARARWLGLEILPEGTLSVPEGSGDGSVALSGEMKQWHKTTLTLDGPFAEETGRGLNPFLQYRMDVVFTHTGTGTTYTVPGYFAADGNAAETSADSGNKWRAHLAADHTGEWSYQVSFLKGDEAAVDPANATPLAPYHGRSGTFTIARTDKSLPDNRARGRLEYVGERYLKFAGNGQYFIKAGPDSPETFLAYSEFDGTSGRGLKTYAPHIADWSDGDPTWKNDKGKGIIGSINYLAGKGANVFSFIPYNRGGDGDNVWPHVQGPDMLVFDVSKLDQWGIVFDHADSRGMFLHFKTQETENDDRRDASAPGGHEAALDQGRMGTERALYYRELIARYSHLLALNWNLGEENTQSVNERRAMAQYFYENDPYNKSETARRHIVIHSYPTASQQDEVYGPLLGTDNQLSGASLQNPSENIHERVKKWLADSKAAGRQWAVANDEQGSPEEGIPPDIGYDSYTGAGVSNTQDNMRDRALYGTLFAGGWGIESYFGYELPQTDLDLEDFRSRDRWWEYCAHAIHLFDEYLPFWEMEEAASLTSGKYALAKTGESYAIYVADGAATTLDLTGVAGKFDITWYNPRDGGPAVSGPAVASVDGGGVVNLGASPAPGNDWVAIVQRDTDRDDDGLPDAFEDRYGEQSPDSNDDGDDLDALLEYVLGTDPTQYNTLAEINVVRSGADNVFNFEFTQDNAAVADYAIVVEHSSDLVAWSQVGIEIDAAYESVNAEVSRSRARLSAAGRDEQVFFRLRVESR